MKCVGRLLLILAFLSADAALYGMYIPRSRRIVRRPATTSQPYRRLISTRYIASKPTPTATSITATTANLNTFERPSLEFTFTPISESLDWWSQIKSYFTPHVKSSEELADTIKKRIRVSFDFNLDKNNNLQEIQHLLVKNKEFINTLNQPSKLYFGQDHETPFDFDPTDGTPLHKLPDDSPSRQLTIVDILLNEAIRGNNSLHSPFRLSANVYDFWVSDRVFPIIDLVAYAISLGGTINPARAEVYKQAYLKLLMPAYKYKYNYWGHEKAKEHIETMKKFFKKIDPIFAYLMPDFKPEIIQAQDLRYAIEQNPTAIEEAFKEQESRNEFRIHQAQRKEGEWRRQREYWEPDFREEWYEDLDLSEEAYQQWLKEKKEFFEQMAAALGRLTDQPKITFFTLIGLDPKSSPTDAEVKKAYGATVKMKHPDTNPDLKSGAISVEQANQQFNELYTARENYEFWKLQKKHQAEKVAKQRASE